MPKLYTGAVPSPKDSRDYQFCDIPGAASPVVPYHSEVRDIIVNQRTSSQCGACAITAARYETEYLQNGNTKALSHTYVYGSDYDYDGEGMYLRTVMKIAKDGIPYSTNWEVWGSKAQCRGLVKSHMTQEIREEAHKLRGTSYYACNTWTEVLNAARVTNGSAVILMQLYENWNNVGENGIVASNRGSFIGNHFLRVKDYEILPNGVYKIRCQNSWGKNWGDNGYCYLYSNQHMFLEAMALVDDIDEVVRKLTFTDVANERWSAEAIKWCADKGIIDGFDDGTFKPTEPMTREQVASVLYRLGKKCGV